MGNTHVKPHPRPRNKKQVHWKSADRPSAPGKPQLITENEATPDLITIRWSKPTKDGGSPISGYLVEHRRTGSPHWVRATPLMVPFPELTVSGLEPGWRYQFRVSAENAVGLSDPGELSEPITVTLQRSAITAPRFTQELQNATALENEKVEFTVHFLGQPAPKVCWFKDGFEIFSSRRIRILTEHDKSILTIHQSALGDEGEIKCTATNRAGHVSTKAKLSLEAPPAIRLPRQYEEGLLFEIGEMIRLKVQVAGRPTPLVFWCHDGETIQTNDRYELEYDDKCSILKINEARRTDRGEYQIKAVNKLGEDHASFLVTVTDKPSPPGKARVVMTLGRSVTLSWSLPNDDGGCKIGNYIVEYYRVGWNVWLKAATSRQLTTMLGDLIEGSEYKFRIKAESPYGISDPSEETDVVFIPDPKRGITQPIQSRGRSQPRDILDDISAPVAAKRKNKPRSQSSSRAEERQDEYGLQNSISNAGIPRRPDRLKIKSPPKTPDSSPMPTRKAMDTSINRAMFDRSSMARELAYGSPEIKVKKELNAPDYILNYSSSEKSKSPSPVQSNQSVSEPNPERSRSVSFSSQKSRSPSPAPPRTKSPRENHENFTGSSEFMLVLYPDENEKGAGIASEFSFDFDENSIPPPMSLSAPELSKEPPEMLFNLRNSASSTELLHERALMRFYQAAEAEEAELERKRMASENKRNSVDIPKIQINNKDNQKVVGLEKKHSLRRKSAGITHEQALMVQRRHSLRSPSELKEVLPPNNLQKYSPEDKRELMMLRQRSESEEKEEEEFERIRKKMQDKVKFEKKVVRVADMEKWSDDYEESTDEEEDKEIDSSDESKSRETVYHLYDFSDSEEEPYHPPGRANANDNEPFEILTKRKNLPDPNFVPKPILKKKDHEDNIQYDLIQPEIKKKKKRSHSPMPPDAVQRERSQSLVEQLLDPLTDKMFRNKKNGEKKEAKARQRSLSLILKNNEKLQSLEKINEEEKVLPTHNIKAATAFSTIAAAGIIIPQKLLEKKQDNEEAKVVIDHYGDIIRTASLKKKVNQPTKIHYETETLYTATECIEPSIESQLQTVEVVDIIIPKAVNTFEPEKKLFSRRDITNEKVDSNIAKEQGKRKVSASPMKKSKRTPSQSPGRRSSLTTRRSKSKSPVRNENWSTLRSPPEKPKRKTSPSPMRKDIKKKSSSPHLNRRKISRSPSPSPSRSRTNSYSRPRPLLKEIMTQTSVGLESFSDEFRSATPLKYLKQEELIARAEIKVKSVMDYITDLSMFMVACWLYLFKNELFAIPVLVVMIYRQLTDEIKRRMPKRWLPIWMSKIFARKKLD
ncbi:unnamed protein product [Brassicogethes aeneus]|uniref:Uncharacterized protein n=1 Tax=Brassicogethes aeneus TaxID=1431903 RepID=A0A9P0AS51_BRAAE|nr:unnamed protein product [Brassicogethes aeneus]